MTAPAVPRRRRRWATGWRRSGVPVVTLAVAAGTTALAVPHPVVLLAAGAAVVALLIADRPSLATSVAVGLVFSNAAVVATAQHGVPRPFTALVPLLLLVTIGHRVCIQRLPLVLPRATPWAMGLLVIVTVGAAASREPAAALDVAQTFLVEGLALWLLVANAARSAETLRLAALVLVAAATFLSVLSVVQQITNTEDDDRSGFAQVSEAVVDRDDAAGRTGERRHAGPLGEQNRWAQNLALVIPLAIALAATDRSRPARLGAAGGVIAIGAGIVLTYSRGAAVGLVLAALVAMALRWVPRAVTLAALVVAALALSVAAPVFLDRASTVVTARGSATGQETTPVEGEDGSTTDGSFSNRATEASAAVAVFVHHPLVGVGPGLFPTYFQDEARRLGADRIVGVNREAHNLYLGLAAETGILGLLAFAGVIATTLGPLAATRRRLQSRRPDLAGLATGYAMAVVVYLTTGLFLHFAYIRYFWLFAGLAAAMGLVREGQPDTTEPAPPPATGTPALHHPAGTP